MTCRSEHPTRHNGAVGLRLRHQLEYISALWHFRRTRKINRRNRERRSAIIKWRKERRAMLATKRKVRAWTKDITTLHAALLELRRKYQKDHTSVTAADWTAAVAGQERKLQVIYGEKFKRDKWPKGVQYLNLIAAAEHQRKKKAATMRKIMADEMKRPALTSRPFTLPTTGRADVSTTSATAPPPQVPVSIHDQIRAMEHANIQAEKQLALLSRSRVNPASISYKQWLDATEGTDAPTRDTQIAGIMEMARRKELGEEFSGWAFGRYYGP